MSIDGRREGPSMNQLYKYGGFVFVLTLRLSGSGSGLSSLDRNRLVLHGALLTSSS